MAQELTYQSEYTGQQMDAKFDAVAQLQEAVAALQTAVAAKYSKPADGIPSTDLDADVNAALAKANSAIQSLADYYTKSEVDALIATINGQQYVDVSSLPTASASTMGKIYLVGPDASGYYSYYYTSYDGSAYSWVGPLGTTQISLANYATKDELSQLDQEVDALYGGSGTEVYYDSDNNINRLSELESVYPNKQLLANASSLGKALSQVAQSNLDGYTNHILPLPASAISVTYSKYNSSSGYGCLFLNENRVVIGYRSGSAGDNQPLTLDIPEGAAFFVWSIKLSTPPRYLGYTYSSVGVLDKIQEKSYVTASGQKIRMKKGKVAADGSVVTDSAYVTLAPVYGDFFLELNDGFRIYSGHLFDRDGNIVSFNHIHPSVYHSPYGGTWSDRTFFSTGNAVPDYGLCLVICKTGQAAISDDDVPVKNFVTLADAKLHRWIPQDLDKYDVALRRLEYFQHLRWKPLAKVPDSYGTNVANNYFCLAEQIQVGAPYSDVAQTRKYVPNDVSIRTFLTALKNRRSLIYTEELQTNVSKYGMTYEAGSRRAYYGSACSALTAWVMGLKTLYITSSIPTIPGMSVVTPVTVNALRPLDLYLREGHVCLVSDILKDEFGTVKYVVLSEMSTPYPYRTIYTPAQFLSRLSSDSATIYRWANWSGIEEPEESGLVQYNLGDVLQNVPYNKDIMCFAGDYACFAEGDTIYLNAKRNSVYTGVQLYKNDVLLQTIDITGLSADTIVTPNTDDWVAVNLTTLNLSSGKYKARMTDGTNTTDYTYFEVVGMTLSATKSGDNIVVAFASTGTPVSIEQCQTSGFEYKIKMLSAADIEAGTVTLSWTYSSYYPMLYLIARGDYGTAVKRISFPQV